MVWQPSQPACCVVREGGREEEGGVTETKFSSPQSLPGGEGERAGLVTVETLTDNWRGLTVLTGLRSDCKV